MFLRRALGIVGLLAACVLFASCVKSKYPASDPDTAVPDKALYGVWARVSDEGTREILIIGSELKALGVPEGIMTIKRSELKEDGRFGLVVGKGDISAISTPFNGFGILSELPWRAVHGLDENGKDIGWDKSRISEYVLMKYSVAGETLEIWDGTDDAVIKAIKSGAIKGELTRNAEGVVDGGRLTETTAGLQRFFANGGDKVLFPDSGKSTFTRVVIR